MEDRASQCPVVAIDVYAELVSLVLVVTLLQVCILSFTIQHGRCILVTVTPGPFTASTCPANLCQNGGSCQSVPGGGYRCLCRPGFTGVRCDVPTGAYIIIMDKTVTFYRIFSHTYYVRLDRLSYQSVPKRRHMPNRPGWWFPLYMSCRLRRQFLCGN